MKPKLDEEICLFVRDEQTGRFLFNAEALELEALRINPVSAAGISDEGANRFRRSIG